MTSLATCPTLLNTATRYAVAVLSASVCTTALGQQTQSADTIEEVTIIGERQTYGSNTISDSMKMQQSPITSVNALLDNLPGVSIQEGDSYGFDDWSTTIAVRGFQISLADQQIGTTIDGIPNGGSNYGGGSKANRYLDSANLKTVTVSQGTADIGSRSLEALGGTIDFVTQDPEAESRIRMQGAFGEYDAERYYVRYDTGTFLGNTSAWISASSQEASDWVNGAAENERDHLAAKLVSRFERGDITAYLSYDDIQENNYQRLFSPEAYAEDSGWDRLTDTWTGVPYVDQVNRNGWATLRENTLGYLKGDFEFDGGLRIEASGYFHDNKGRGDWIPPYLLDVVDDAGGPQSEALGLAQVDGGGILGQIFFVDDQGSALSPEAGCVSSITFPYGGAGPQYDPACYAPGALAVQSYRSTNYEKERRGLTLDATWDTEIAGFANTLRGGVWYEDATRDETRTWSKITDTRVGIAFDNTPYWTQYDRSYPQDTLKWYLEDSADVGDFTFSLGVKQFLVDVEREDNFGETPNAAVDSDSDALFSGGVVWQAPIEGLEVFAGYAENFKAIGDEVLERPSSDLGALEPETAENVEFGLRYANPRYRLSATYYDVEFSDRIIFLSPESASGPNYDIGTNGTYFNAGGIDSSGLELTADVDLTPTLSLYGAYTYSDATYVGTGDPSVDTGLGVVPGNDVVGIPSDQLVLSLDWVRGGLAAGLTGKYTGERAVRLDNSWVAEDYITADAYFTLTGDNVGSALSGWSVTLLVNNLFDEEYLGAIAGEGAWIGAPRTLSASFTLDI